MDTYTRTEIIKLWGIVQGVGFRPFVAKLANRLGMKGTVLNIGGLVEITLTDTPERIDAFIQMLKSEKPEPAEIVHIKRARIEPAVFHDFRIISSDQGGDEAAMIPPDMAVCPNCIEELYDPEDPRYMHPFISCMICGPRYTIIDRIPYDRENTTMVDFPLCSMCDDQYRDLNDRRHHAQTISCHDCGPYLKLRERSGRSFEENRSDHAKILDRVSQIIKNGGVIAFKCVGGYNLVADPFDPDAVSKLRQIKGREEKPFAVLFRSVEQMRKYCFVDDVEERLLESSARPIILLEHGLREIDPAATDCPKGEADMSELLKSRFIGSFLPSLAAQYLLLDRTGPLIFTSANRSDLPMIKDDDEMFDFFDSQPLLDGVVYNDRRINTRVDDSVCRVIDGQPQMIRRSKGYAPLPLYLDVPSAPSVFAAGGQLKNSFVLSKGPFMYTSQYFGDLDSIENQETYSSSFDDMRKLFRIDPSVVACDMHPLYETTRFAKEYAKGKGLPLIEVQHHHAHVASVMAENDLKGPVIGVSFDGTGYGTDGRIWGGEFLLCEGGSFERLCHLRYVDMLGGDPSMKDARRSALSYLLAEGRDKKECPGSDESGCRQFKIDISDIVGFGGERLMGCPDSAMIIRAIESKINTITSSSMGRLFDAVSALLGICDHNRYEGQCAIMLEDAAAFAKKNPGIDRASDLALAFHQRVIDKIVEECLSIREEKCADQVALTGGTFQNKILMEGVLERLRELDFKPFYNISVSPNDGGIALGQAYVAMHRDDL